MVTSHPREFLPSGAANAQEKVEAGDKAAVEELRIVKFLLANLQHLVDEHK